MIIIGDAIVPYEVIQVIQTKQDIALSAPNSTIIFDFNPELMSYCHANDVRYGVVVHSIREALYANALKASYAISTFQMAQAVQAIAEDYLFDTKVLSIINDYNMLEEVALARIDGVIYSQLLHNKGEL
jgi:hypothetical protein